MEITSELLQSIYTRAIQFAITKFGIEPDRIEIDGESITARFTDYRNGYDDTTEYISAENLTADLEDVARERIKRLDEERIKMQEQRRVEQQLREANEKNQRRATYEKLKKEFES